MAIIDKAVSANKPAIVPARIVAGMRVCRRGNSEDQHVENQRGATL